MKDGDDWNAIQFDKHSSGVGENHQLHDAACVASFLPSGLNKTQDPGFFHWLGSCNFSHDLLNNMNVLQPFFSTCSDFSLNNFGFWGFFDLCFHHAWVNPCLYGWRKIQMVLTSHQSFWVWQIVLDNLGCWWAPYCSIDTWGSGNTVTWLESTELSPLGGWVSCVEGRRPWWLVDSLWISNFEGESNFFCWITLELLEVDFACFRVSVVTPR